MKVQAKNQTKVQTFLTWSFLGIFLTSAVFFQSSSAHAARSEVERTKYLSEQIKEMEEDAHDMRIVSGILGAAVGTGLAVWTGIDANYASSRSLWIGVGIAMASVSVWQLFKNSPGEEQADLLNSVMGGSESATYKLGFVEGRMRSYAEYMKATRQQGSIFFGAIGLGALIGGATGPASNSAGNTTAMTAGGVFLVSGLIGYFVKSKPEQDWQKYQDWMANSGLEKKAELYRPSPQVFLTPALSGPGLGAGIQFSL